MALLKKLIERYGGNIGQKEENLIKQLLQFRNTNNMEQSGDTLLNFVELGQHGPDLALDTFGLLFEGVMPDYVGAPPQQVPAPIPAIQQQPMMPADLDELIDVIQTAVQEQNTVKAIGTGHSVPWTDIRQVQHQQSILIDMSELDNDIDIDRTLLKHGAQILLDDRMICCFQAGTTIGQVQDQLWARANRADNPDQFRVLLNQTGCVDLSLSVTIGIGAHGNGLQRPILADTVLSFLIITVNRNGNIVQNQIEPTNGITNPYMLIHSHPERNLIQDDNTFNAALVNIGGMGIVYSYILRTEKAFYLTETRNFLPWDQAKQEIEILYERNTGHPDGVVGSLHSFEIFVNPYPIQNQIGVLICTLEYANGPPQGTRPHWHLIPHEWVRNGFVHACENFPRVIPVLLKILMLASRTNQPVTMDAVKALNPLSGLEVSGDVIVSECAMETQNSADVIAKIQALIDVYRNILDTNEHQLANCPFSVRFSRPANAYMAMQYNRQSMMISSNILVGTRNADKTLHKFRNLMQDHFQGRPHWGMVQDVDANDVGRIYPSNNGVDPVDAFRNVMLQLDPRGVFRYQFINRVFFPVQNH